MTKFYHFLLNLFQILEMQRGNKKDRKSWTEGPVRMSVGGRSISVIHYFSITTCDLNQIIAVNSHKM